MNTNNLADFAKLSLTSLRQVQKVQEGIHLVLSGGGVKGVAHLALIEYLEKCRIPIRAISGSSAGALVGALYCSGMATKDILSFFKSTPIFKYTWLNPVKAGIFDSEKYVSILEENVKYRFEDLRIPLTIAATNIERNEVVYFDHGELTHPLLASCAVPAVFSPVKIKGELYSDGGIMDNFPILPFLDQDVPIIGSYTSSPSPKTAKELNSILKVSNHANSLLLYSANVTKFNSTTSTVIFPLGDYSAFDTNNIDKIYQKAQEFILSKVS